MPASPPNDPQATAERVRAGLLARDRASRGMGMDVTAIGPGRATVTMTVREDMLNGFDICHGGFIATLADSAFAFACNAYDELTVASGFGLELLAPARLGDRLTATATEQSLSGRLGVYDVVVTREDASRIALFRGRSYRVKGRPAVPPEG